MPQILTFLGQPRSQCAIASVAMAHKLAQQGAKVLWMTQDSSPLSTHLLGQTPTPDVQSIASNFWAIQLQATALLEQSWEIVKNLEAQYLRNPLLKEVFGEELAILPGMDEALSLNAIREIYDTATYDYLIFDGHSGQTTLRMWGMPENLDWYIRRFQKVLEASELARTLAPFIQPLAGAILNVSGGQDVLNQPFLQSRSLLDAGRAAVQSRHQMLGFLVTTANEADRLIAKHLWGCAQQIGLTVGGVIAGTEMTETPWADMFAPLPIHPLPQLQTADWQPLVDALPSLASATNDAPAPVEIDETTRQVHLFMPGFAKTDIGLTQHGPEVTVTAGDQRRNLLLPNSLRHQAVKGAKFQDNYLILSF
ncbi:MAG: ArsA family ATPase [Cyanobacteria bacterium P01_H01_bin.58]